MIFCGEKNKLVFISCTILKKLIELYPLGMIREPL